MATEDVGILLTGTAEGWRKEGRRMAEGGQKDGSSH